jgi:Ger(x)C family germination protein
MILKSSSFLKIIGFIVAISFLMVGADTQPIEELDITIGIGYDIDRIGESSIEYIVSTNIYTFEGEDKISSIMLKGRGPTLGEANADRQRRSSSKYIEGYEKIYIFSREQAEAGIKNIADSLFGDPAVNDKGLIMVFHGRAEDALKHKPKGHPSASDQLEGILRNASNYNFFLKRYDLMDVFRGSQIEGRSLIMPYVELKEEGFEISGLAIFKDHKMVANLNTNETKFTSLLRENKVKGIITIQESPTRYINFYAKTRRKVKCEKIGDKYHFTINIACRGEVISNELFPSLLKDYSSKRESERAIEEKIEELCYRIINKMKKEYKVDVLELGRIAAAKYGRHTGVDWDEVICNSRIDVKVDLEIERVGRGDY